MLVPVIQISLIGMLTIAYAPSRRTTPLIVKLDRKPSELGKIVTLRHFRNCCEVRATLSALNMHIHHTLQVAAS